VRFAPESPTAAETLRTVLQSRGESEEAIQSRMRELRGK
jgi:hypothetical protein